MIIKTSLSGNFSVTCTIKKKFLIFREDAKKIERITREKLKNFDSVLLDFSNVEFLSRSFIDELLNIMIKEKRIKIINFKPLLERLFNKIKKTKQEIQKEI